MASSRTIKSLGFDIGKKNDPPALIEITKIEGTPIQTVTECRRLPLRMPYPKLVELVEPIVDSVDICIMDGSGVGEAIYDYLRESFTKVWSVVTTSGKQSIMNQRMQTLNIPKWMLIDKLVSDIEHSRIRFNNVGDVPTLVAELQTFQRRQSGRSTTIKYEAKAGEHDDLVLALALARLGFGLEGLEQAA